MHKKKYFLIYSYNSPNNDLPSHIIYTISQIRAIFVKIIFISSSSLKKQHREVLDKYVHDVIERENIGLDFGAWKDAINYIGWDEVAQYDSLTLMNDTVFGPMFDLRKIFKKMEEEAVDFWGLTNNKIIKRGGFKKFIPEHLQSCYLTFTKKVVCSNGFQKFWDNIQYNTTRSDAILNYETRLTKMLREHGFVYNSYINTTETIELHPNQEYFYPEILLRTENPFIKIQSFLNHDNPGYLLDQIRKKTKYPIELIEEYFTKFFIPNVSYRIVNKNVILSDNCCSESSINTNIFKIALHMHVYYIDVFVKYIESLTKNKFIPDLFISTDTNEKKELIMLIIKKYKLTNYIKDIIICKNRGRDVAPWLIDFNKINSIYDIVGHFHTKKSEWQDEWIGTSWQDEILDLLIVPLPKIINIFQNKNIGVVIMDVPTYSINNVSNNGWGRNNKIKFSFLWEKMSCEKNIDVKKIVTPIMPYGNMYWYRPAALKPLFEMGLSIYDFPEEPIPNEGTLAHAIERLPVYIAWNQNYDFRIVLHKKYIKSFFFFKENILSNTYGKIKTKYLRKIIFGLNNAGRIIYLFDKAIDILKRKGFKVFLKRTIDFFKMVFYGK